MHNVDELHDCGAEYKNHTVEGCQSFSRTDSKFRRILKSYLFNLSNVFLYIQNKCVAVSIIFMSK